MFHRLTGNTSHLQTLQTICQKLVPSYSSPSPFKPERLNNKFFKIPFRYGDRSFFYLLKIKRGLMPVVSISDESGNDVMQEVEPYLGPNFDCGNSGVTPADFGYKRLVIVTAGERIAEFEENDPITLK
jgi:hypothetical protein